MTKDEMIKQLLQQVNSLTSTVDSLNATINTQTQLIVQLNQTIQELKEQLNKNSKNSSKPPSSDGYKKTAPKSLRKPSGKKVGGQDGHQGTHLAVITAPDEIVTHMPSACKGCRHYQMCKGTACIAEKRHVIDAAVTVNVTEHQVLELPICMLHGDTRRGEFPADVKAAVQYGENLQSLAVALNTVGAVSIKRTHEILSGVFNIPIETGTRVDKKLWWVHDASNCEYTYLDISPKRGNAGMEQCGVLPEFKGIAMHDCWASYWKYPDIQHAVCCAHLLRELTGIDENHPEQKWASAFIDLLLEMKKVKDVSGCFRTEEGARDYLKIMSYVGTAHKQGYNAYEAIKNAISGHPNFIFE
ncbi:MAG: DUF6444 domain-containing protein [Agathobacter sp.]